MSRIQTRNIRPSWGFPLCHSKKQIWLVSMRMRVGSLALLSGSGLQCCHGVGCRLASDPALLWLWCRLVAAAPVWPLAWELPCAVSATLKRKEKKTKQNKNRKQTGVPQWSTRGREQEGPVQIPRSLPSPRGHQLLAAHRLGIGFPAVICMWVTLCTSTKPTSSSQKRGPRFPVFYLTDHNIKNIKLYCKWKNGQHH